MTEFDTRTITASQAVRGRDGAVALALFFDRGAPVAGRIDIQGVRLLREQLDRIEAFLASPTDPAE